MKKTVYLLALLAVTGTLSACDGDTPTTPSTPGDNSATYTATLLPGSEVPPVAGAEADGTGTATLTFNLTRDAGGTVTAATLDATVTVTGFPAGTALTASHIHPGATGSNGGIFVSLGLAAGEVTFANGSGSFTRRGIPVTVDQATAIVGNPAAFYLNIHTAANPGGVARGQLIRTP